MAGGCGPAPSKAFEPAPDGADFEPYLSAGHCGRIYQASWIVGSRAQRGAMWFGLPLNPEAALCASIMGSPMWLRSVMTGALCGRIRALSPSPTQHALLPAIMSQAFSSLGCAHERPWKACGARSCLYPQKL